jgi:hypothetical protein
VKFETVLPISMTRCLGGRHSMHVCHMKDTCARYTSILRDDPFQDYKFDNKLCRVGTPLYIPVGGFNGTSED